MDWSPGKGWSTDNKVLLSDGQNILITKTTVPRDNVSETLVNNFPNYKGNFLKKTFY